MTDNDRLANWQGLDSHICDEDAFHCDWCESGSMQTPDYINDDAVAMSLLDTLVEKGYTFTLFSELHDNKFFGCCVWEHESSQWTNPAAESFNKPTPREAVVAAVLELIKEDV